MNSRFSELYQAMLSDLHGRLEEADRIFIRMSELLLDMMLTEKLSGSPESEFRVLNHRHRVLLTETAADLRRVYSGRIEEFPPESGGFIENLEQRNAQAEELERIVNSLMKENGCGMNTRSAEAGNGLRKILKNIDSKAETERNEKAGPLFRRPNILVSGKNGVGKTSLIQAVTRRGTVPESAVGNASFSWRLEKFSNRENLR